MFAYVKRDEFNIWRGGGTVDASYEQNGLRRSASVRQVR